MQLRTEKYWKQLETHPLFRDICNGAEAIEWLESLKKDNTLRTIHIAAIGRLLELAYDSGVRFNVIDITPKRQGWNS